MVMLALLAVLLGSLGYLSMQGGGREGNTGMMTGACHKDGRTGAKINGITSSTNCRSPNVWV